MKKSECFKMAQIAVLEYGKFAIEEKLEVIRELQDKENTALYTERREAEKSLEEACHKSLATTASSKAEREEK